LHNCIGPEAALPVKRDRPQYSRTTGKCEIRPLRF